MMTKIKEKIKNAWEWIKDKTRRFKKWLLALLGIGVVLAAGVALEAPQVPCIDFNGKEICTPYTDSISGEDILIFSDKSEYIELGEAKVYLAVKNRAEAQNIRLQTYFQSGKSQLVKIERFVPDIPYQVLVPDYEDYECKICNDTSMLDIKKCPITKVIMTTCQRKIGEHQETRYRDEWQENPIANLEVAEKELIDTKRVKPISEQFSTEKSSQIFLNKDEVAYFKATIKFPIGTNEEFLVEAIGDKGAGGLLDPWYNASWSSRKKITIQTTNVDADQANFPLLVKISADGDMLEAQADGDDIRFTSSDGETLLKYEEESWSGGGGSAVTADFWVKSAVTTAGTGATDIYIYYGNAGASDGQDAVNVWDANFVGVYHLGEAGATLYDSTGNNLDLTAAGSLPVSVACKVGNGQDCDGNGDYGYSAYADWMQTADNITFEAWVNPDSWTTDTYPVPVYCGDAAGYRFEFLYNVSASASLRVYFVSSGDKYDLITTPPTGQWSHIAGKFDMSNVTGYYNGDPTGSPTAATTALGDRGTDTVVRIGNAAWGTNADYDGKIDEVRFSISARADAWIKFEYHNIANADNELDWAAEEATPSGERRIIIVS